MIEEVLCPEIVRRIEKEEAIDELTELANKFKKLYTKYTQIYKKEFLKSKDYDDSNLEDLKSKIKRKWGKFLEEDFKNIINKMTFPTISDQ